MLERIVGLFVAMIVGEVVSQKVVTKGPEVMVNGTQMRTGVRVMEIEIGRRQQDMRTTGIGREMINGSIGNSTLNMEGGVALIGNQALGIGTQQLNNYHELKDEIH